MEVYRKELEQFGNKIRALGYSETDFEISYIRWRVTAKHPSATSDLVIVARYSNRIRKAYAADVEANWLRSFYDDLSTGVFGMLTRHQSPSAFVGVVRDLEPAI